MAPIKGFKEYVKRNKEPVKPNENLKSVLEFLEISNLALAKALIWIPPLSADTFRERDACLRQVRR